MLVCIVTFFLMSQLAKFHDTSSQLSRVGMLVINEIEYEDNGIPL